MPLAIALLPFAVLPCQAQIPKRPARPAIPVTEAAVQSPFVTRAAVPTKRIPRRDASNRELDPNTPWRLPNGTIITAKQYFDGLNQLEAKLNASGYSLRSGPAVQRVATFTV